MEKGQEVRYDIVHVIGNEHLVAIELYLVLLYRHTVLDFREIEDTGEVERIVHIEVDMEERLLVTRIEGPIELHIVLFLEFRRPAGPERCHIIDDIVLVSVLILAVLPLLLLAEDYRNRHEFAVLGEEAADLTLGCILC